MDVEKGDRNMTWFKAPPRSLQTIIDIVGQATILPEARGERSEA